LKVDGQGFSLNEAFAWGKAGAVVVSAGTGKRMGAAISKQYLPIGGKPIVVHALEAFETAKVTSIVLVVGADDVQFAQGLVKQYRLNKVVAVVPGGTERQHSVRLGLEALARVFPDVAWVLVHDAARPLVTPEVMERCLEAAANGSGAAVPAVPVKDTIKSVNDDGVILATPERKSLWAVQTPQAFRYDLLWEAHQKAAAEQVLGTDDAMLVERLGIAVSISEGDYRNVKVTTPDDLAWVERLITARSTKLQTGVDPSMFRIGQGFDVHQLVEGRPCIIGGVHIPFEKGLLGHSDADVLLHAVADAVLGALGLGDIGQHFPDTDPAFKDADSLKLLEHVWGLARERGYALGNADCTILAERPKIAPHMAAICANIARALDADVSQVNVKATTTEKLGVPGRGEGIVAQATVLLYPINQDVK